MIDVTGTDRVDWWNVLLFGILGISSFICLFLFVLLAIMEEKLHNWMSLLIGLLLFFAVIFAFANLKSEFRKLQEARRE